MSMLHRFQFQYGTIKTYDHFRDQGGKVFQFQYGTIKTVDKVTRKKIIDISIP